MRFRTEPESAKIHTGRLWTAPSTKNSCILGVPGVDSSLIAGIAASVTRTGELSSSHNTFALSFLEAVLGSGGGGRWRRLGFRFVGFRERRRLRHCSFRECKLRAVLGVMFATAEQTSTRGSSSSLTFTATWPLSRAVRFVVSTLTAPVTLCEAGRLPSLAALTAVRAVSASRPEIAEGRREVLLILPRQTLVRYPPRGVEERPPRPSAHCL